jgi:hypothetical protein
MKINRPSAKDPNADLTEGSHHKYPTIAGGSGLAIAVPIFKRDDT